MILNIKKFKIKRNKWHIAFVHHTAVNEDTGEVKLDDIPKVVVEKK